MSVREIEVTLRVWFDPDERQELLPLVGQPRRKELWEALDALRDDDLEEFHVVELWRADG